jgi:hypothetical protein
MGWRVFSRVYWAGVTEEGLTYVVMIGDVKLLETTVPRAQIL